MVDERRPTIQWRGTGNVLILTRENLEVVQLRDPGQPLFQLVCAFIGPSMLPTLREHDIIEIQPYQLASVTVGDVILFSCPDDLTLIVHRVAGRSHEGFLTRGDNNKQMDLLPVSADNVIGRVVAIWRGNHHRRIANGWVGRLTAQRAHMLCDLNAPVSRFLHLPYHLLSRLGLFRGLLPNRLKPRLVQFNSPKGNVVKIILGRRVIGAFDQQSSTWRIDRPYRLFIDERNLTVPAASRSSLEP